MNVRKTATERILVEMLFTKIMRERENGSNVVTSMTNGKQRAPGGKWLDTHFFPYEQTPKNMYLSDLPIYRNVTHLITVKGTKQHGAHNVSDIPAAMFMIKTL